MKKLTTWALLAIFVVAGAAFAAPAQVVPNADNIMMVPLDTSPCATPIIMIAAINEDNTIGLTYGQTLGNGFTPPADVDNSFNTNYVAIGSDTSNTGTGVSPVDTARNAIVECKASLAPPTFRVTKIT